MKTLEEPEILREAREKMVHSQIELRGIQNAAVLAAMRAVPRHVFVPSELVEEAYDDCPLPIGEGQTISQPYIVALMTALLRPRAEQRVLEVGTGSGYQAAVLAQVVRDVYTLERIGSLAARAGQLFERLELGNVHVQQGDGCLGWPEAAPFDGIILTAGAPQIPQPLFDQLAEGGRLVGPVGSRFHQMLQVWVKQGGRLEGEDTIPVAFVPLRGQFGWGAEEW
ncbi:MAG: protein-L-isoaspartate(D-aspartate) O-methyltransferase [Chloroflexi bacterium]|nr:protein-L-isoaspartate(D-aspartate) O-methyltransferase [Chloroflexota bacterium]